MRSLIARQALCALMTAALLVLGASCGPRLEGGAYRCRPEESGTCPDGWVCQCRGAGCDDRCYPSSGAYCGDGRLDPGEECDGPALDPAASGVGAACGFGSYCRPDCTLRCAQCGNGLFEQTPTGDGEECDDGNQLSGDGCSAACRLERCGNGLVEPDELCDDGNNRGGDGCSADCRSDERCGNNVVDPVRGEQCDDGNISGGDGCSPACTFERCGNGLTDAGEVCDCGTDPVRLPAGCTSVNGTPFGSCSADCQSRLVCGNGIVDVQNGEQCDCGADPLKLPASCASVNADLPNATCRANCTLPRCGDGVVDPAKGEQCEGTSGLTSCQERGYYTGVLACSALFCQFDTSACRGRCGDGALDVGFEQCDLSDFGGKSCADFNRYSGRLACSLDCQRIDSSLCTGFCGDGQLNGGEQCEASNLANRTCQSFGYYGGTLRCAPGCDGFDTSGCVGYCGDGIVNGIEECDGRDQGGAYCTSFPTYSAGSLGCDAFCRRTWDRCVASGWTVEASGTTALLNDILTLGDYSVAVGRDGLLLERVGGVWTRVTQVGAPSGTSINWPPDTLPHLNAIGHNAASASNEIWVAGDGGILLRGSVSTNAPRRSWRLEPIPSSVQVSATTGLQALWVDSLGLIALAENQLIERSATGVWATVNPCAALNPPGGCALGQASSGPWRSALWRAPTGEVFIVGDVAAPTTGRRVYVRGPASSGGVWSLKTAAYSGGGSPVLRAVQGQSATSYWVAGDNGALLWNTGGSSWLTEPTAISTALRRLVTGLDGRWYAVGDGGVLLMSGQSGWTRLDTQTATDLTGVSVTPLGDATIVGNGGLIQRQLAPPWRSLNLGVTPGSGLWNGRIPGVATTGASSALFTLDPATRQWVQAGVFGDEFNLGLQLSWVQAIGGQGSALFLGGSLPGVCGYSEGIYLARIEGMSSAGSQRVSASGWVRGLWATGGGSTPDATWAVGEQTCATPGGGLSTLCRWSGAPAPDQWVGEEIDPLSFGSSIGTPLAISGTSQTHLLVSTDTGAILGYVPAAQTGASGLAGRWRQLPSPTTDPLHGVVALPGGGAVMVGGSPRTEASRSRVVWYDQDGATLRPAPTSQRLYAVWGASFDNLFAVGDQGTLLHFDGDVWTPTALSGAAAQADLNSVSGTPNDGFVVVSGSSAATQERISLGLFTPYPTLPGRAIPLSCSKGSELWFGSLTGASSSTVVSCPSGGRAPERLYRLHAPLGGKVTVSLERSGAGSTAALFIASGTKDAPTTCLAEASTSGPVTVRVSAGEFLFVGMTGAGTYSLSTACVKEP